MSGLVWKGHWYLSLSFSLCLRCLCLCICFSFLTSQLSRFINFRYWSPISSIIPLLFSFSFCLSLTGFPCNHHPHETCYDHYCSPVLSTETDFLCTIPPCFSDMPSTNWTLMLVTTMFTWENLNSFIYSLKHENMNDLLIFRSIKDLMNRVFENFVTILIDM